MSKRDDALIVAVLHHSDAARIACRMARAPKYAHEDIITDAVIATWQAARERRLDAAYPGNVRAYLFVVATRAAWKWKRARRHETHNEAADVEGPDPHFQLEARSDLGRIAELLGGDASRLLKAFAEGLSGSTIAGEGVPLGTVYTRLRAARGALEAGTRRDAAAERVLLHQTPRKPRRK